MTLIVAYQGQEFAVLGTDLRQAHFSGSGSPADSGEAPEVLLEEKVYPSFRGNHYVVPAGVVYLGILRALQNAYLEELLEGAVPRISDNCYSMFEFTMVDAKGTHLYHRSMMNPDAHGVPIISGPWFANPGLVSVIPGTIYAFWRHELFKARASWLWHIKA